MVHTFKFTITIWFYCVHQKQALPGRLRLMFLIRMPFYESCSSECHRCGSKWAPRQCQTSWWRERFSQYPAVGVKESHSSSRTFHMLQDMVVRRDIMTVLQSKEKTVIESQSEEGLDVRLFFFFRTRCHAIPQPDASEEVCLKQTIISRLFALHLLSLLDLLLISSLEAWKLITLSVWSFSWLRYNSNTNFISFLLSLVWE